MIKVALRYAENDFTLWLNGEKVATDNGGVTGVALLSLDFADTNGNSPFYGRVRQVKHLPYNTNISKL